MKSVGLALAFAVCTFQLGAASIREFCDRAERREPLTVVYFGCSLTWGANASDPNRTSWRALSGEKLRRQYPNTPFRFIDASIGGTSSDSAVFRVERDVLAYKPDLVFVDFTANDNEYACDDMMSRSLEGIFRQLLRSRPSCAVAYVVLPRMKTVKETDVSTLKRYREHLGLATAYNIPIADILGELRGRVARGKLDFESIWPKELKDVTHPFDPGYALYADIVWKSLFENPSSHRSYLIEKSVFPETYRHLLRKSFSGIELPEGWRKTMCSLRAGTYDFLCSRWLDDLVEAAPGAKPFMIRFTGETCLVFGESHKSSGRAKFVVDGKVVSEEDCGAMGRQFDPSAWLVVNLGKFSVGEHDLQIVPELQEGQNLRIGFVGIAGSEQVELKGCSE